MKGHKPVIVLGAGGHAKVLVDCLQLLGRDIIGILEATPQPNRSLLGVEVIGCDDDIAQYLPEHVQLVNGIGSADNAEARKRIFARFKEAGYVFARIVHPSAVIGREVVLGEGVQIMAGAIVQAGCTLGANSIVNTHASVDHDCIIGDHVHIAPGAVLSGGCRVGDSVHIGTGARVIQGITIGQNSLLGAGAVLICDAAEGSKLVGVPARRL